MQNPPASTASLAMTALLTVRPGAQEEFLQTLRGLARELEGQPGCTACVLAQDVNGGTRFLFYLAWADVKSMGKGLVSEPYRVLLGATSTLCVGDGMAFLPNLSPAEARCLAGPGPPGPASAPSSLAPPSLQGAP